MEGDEYLSAVTAAYWSHFEKSMEAMNALMDATKTGDTQGAEQAARCVVTYLALGAWAKAEEEVKNAPH